MTDESNATLDACRAYLKNIDDRLNYITAPELKNILESNPDSVFLLDNRSQEAFLCGHIPGATNIWLKDVLDDDNIALIPKNKKIVVCCWVGHTASQLISILGVLGYDAVGLKYGMGEPALPSELKLGWDEYGFPTK